MSSRAPLCHSWALLRLPPSEVDHTRWMRCLWAPATTLHTHTNIRNARLGTTAASRTDSVRDLVLASKLRQIRGSAQAPLSRSIGSKQLQKMILIPILRRVYRSSSVATTLERQVARSSSGEADVGLEYQARVNGCLMSGSIRYAIVVKKR